MTFSTTVSHDGRWYEVVIPDLVVPKCSNCGNYSLDDEATRVIDAAFRREANLLTPEEIRAGRERLGLNQQEFAENLGVAVSTLSRWETGRQIQQRVLNNYMKGFFDVPELRGYLRRKKSQMTKNVRGFLLELAAEGIAPVVGGCAGAVVAGPAGAAGGAVVGRVVEKAINYFGPRIIEPWLGWFRNQPKNVQIEAVTELGSVPPAEAREVAKDALDRLAVGATPEDKALALEYLAAIPDAVQQSLVLDLTTGEKTVPPSLSFVSQQSLMQLLPTNVPPYVVPTQLPGTPYLLKRVVGAGGFGVVYEAEMPAEQYERRAIKFCLDYSMIDMLKRERDNLVSLMASGKDWSPRIVRLFGYDLEHATPYLVYEFVPGGNLTSHLAKRREEIGGNLPPDEVLLLIQQIAEGLAFAHERKLVHRDLKPANVLIDGKTLKLADFGIGGIMAGYAAAHSQIGQSMIQQLRSDEQVSILRGSGTPLYMDPDQRRGGAANPKHDLYSLGVVWYQLLIGDVTRELAPGFARELGSRFNVPKRHIEIIEQCVGWIDDRPENAGELLKLLQGSIPPPPLPAPPPPPPLPTRMPPGEVAKQLRQRGYLTRQTKQDDPFWLNLGGPQSEINRQDFQGAILLKPDRQQAFGVCCKEIRTFRERVMEHKGSKWVRRTGVPGPAGDTNKVEVHLVDCADAKKGLVCDDNRGQIRIVGYGARLSCQQGYEWADVESFLRGLQEFCSSTNSGKR